MAALAQVGNKLLVVRGTHRGCVGEIIKVNEIGCGLIDYVMVFGNDKTIAYTIPADDCKEYNPGNINLESQFDITNYLSVDTMKDVAKEIYTKKVTDYLDDAFNNRVNVGCGSIPLQVLHIVVDKYADDMFDKYKDDILAVFIKTIKSDTPLSGDEDDKCFSRSIQWALERTATKYIENNPDEISDMMKEQLEATIKRMFEEKLSYSLSKAIEKSAKDFIDSFFKPDENENKMV